MTLNRNTPLSRGKRIKTRFVLNVDVVKVLAAQCEGLMKLSQSALAGRMGVSRTQVHRLMRAESTPTADTLERIALVLGVDPAKAESVLLTVVTDEESA